MHDKYGIYCYSDTDVLINLLNIRDVEVLEEAENSFYNREISFISK